ncbi:hypothetical protein QT383_03820 [Stenotrophomonas rhizophila]
MKALITSLLLALAVSATVATSMPAHAAASPQAEEHSYLCWWAAPNTQEYVWATSLQHARAVYADLTGRPLYNVLCRLEAVP